MLSDKFQSSVRVLKTVIDEDGYYLGWVLRNDRKYLAEISKGYNGGIPAGEWLQKEGILQPETYEKSDDGILTLFFSIPSKIQLIIDKINDSGGIKEETAVLMGIRLAQLLKVIHDSGHRVGYLGPENVLLADNGQPYLLAGARGVPESHFSPPEAIGVEPSDPRSDIYALGLLMFRGIAGTDDKDGQMVAWNNLSEPILKLFMRMADPDISKRFPNFKILLDRLKSLRTVAPGDDSGNKWIPADHSHRSRKIKKNRYLWIPGTLLLIFLLYMLFCSSDGDDTETPTAVEQDTTTNVSAVVDIEKETTTEIIEPIVVFDPVIWITNGTGLSGHAGAFRDSIESSFSQVITCSGGRRAASKIIIRRSTPGVPISQTDDLYTAVNDLNCLEIPMLIQQVDITILIGNDLRDLLSTDIEVFVPVAPEDTLFIDVANYDINRRDNAASWTRAALDERSIKINDKEWLIKVIDYRDGDNYTSEIGIPGILETTVFLYNEDNPIYVTAEEQIRSVLLNPTSIQGDSIGKDYPYPDIWVFLGR